ncbi:MAG: NADH dehydrogenase (quinone) subunit G [Gammaproteobacteria bacterium]|nr:NADH dehydrogenase (quinone) subunit G [Gammaproteobacteria bacterium]
MKIKINNKECNFDKGDTLIQVADKNGIHIPRFCYHDKLSIAANCRMCLIEQVGINKPQPACSTPAIENQEYFTKSKLAVSAQKNTMEFLLINHPLDCPVCDQGGMCELQDQALMHGRVKSRYEQEKRVVVDHNIGPLIKTNMTRCIHCTRCVRYGEEIAGVKEFGAIGRGETMEIRTYLTSAINSPMSGNMIDICPVGALNAKPSHMKGRTWELEEVKYISPHDCVGTNLSMHILDNNVFRIVPHENKKINEVWISDRDRFSYEAIDHNDRVKKPIAKINGRHIEVEWDQAFDIIKEKMNEIDAKKSAGFISANSTVEEQYLFQKWLRENNINNIDHRVSQSNFDYKDEDLIPRLDIPIKDMEDAKSILLIDSNITYDQPILSHKIRKAFLKNAKINSIHTYNYKYNFDINNSLLINPNFLLETLIDIIEYLSVITVNDKTLKNFNIPDGVKRNFKGLNNNSIIEISNDLLINNSLILLGSNLINHPDFQLFKILTNIISILTKSNKGYIGEKSNESGAWLTSCYPTKDESLNVYESIHEKLELYIVYNLDLIDFYHYSELKNSLNSAKFVIGFQSFITEEDKNYYDIILPLATSFESPGTFINIENEWQSFAQGCAPHYMSKEGWKILTKLRLIQGGSVERSLDYLDILNEVDSVIRDNKSHVKNKLDDLNIKKISSNRSLTRCGGTSSYYIDNIVRRAPSLNLVNPIKNLVSVNKKTLEKNNIDLSKNKVIVKQEENTLLAELVIDENVSDDCIYIINSNKEHYDLGKQYQPIRIENV